LKLLIELKNKKLSLITMLKKKVALLPFICKHQNSNAFKRKYNNPLLPLLP